MARPDRAPPGPGMNLRLFVDAPLQAGHEMALPPGAARHAQVRRVQPGDTLSLFDGQGSDWPATVLRMGRSDVTVRLAQPLPVHHELSLAVTLALGMPANERMDALVEKATEMGVACIQPLHCERSVLRLAGERAERKRAHWQAIAQAACEQSGRARVPQVALVKSLHDWLAASANVPAQRLMLSLDSAAPPLRDMPAPAAAFHVHVLSGPEGGLTPAEQASAIAAGFKPASLGPRVLRADTAPLAALAWLSLRAG